MAKPPIATKRARWIELQECLDAAKLASNGNEIKAIEARLRVLRVACEWANAEEQAAETQRLERKLNELREQLSGGYGSGEAVVPPPLEEAH